MLTRTLHHRIATSPRSALPLSIRTMSSSSSASPPPASSTTTTATDAAGGASPPLSFQRTTIALVQLGGTTFSKALNLERARHAVLRAARGPPSSPAGSTDPTDPPRTKVDMIVLPECFNSPYGVQYFGEYAESLHGAYERIKRPPSATTATTAAEHAEARWTVDNANDAGGLALPAHTLESSPTAALLSALARETRAVLVGGSMPERDDATGRLYNTACVFAPDGRLIALHRKLHLFDIAIPGGITFAESRTLAPGERVTVFDCAAGRFGLGVCYDLRFPEPAMVAARLGAGCLVYPGAFNTTTGPVAWELLQRARAADNQVYVLACSPARPSAAAMAGDADEQHGWRQGEKAYPAWGHSTVVGPRGDVKAKLEHGEDVLWYTLERDELDEVRSTIPITTQRRFDVYPDITRG